MNLAKQLIEQNAQDAYDPTAFADSEKDRILAAIDEKIAGKEIVAVEPTEAPASAQVIDLMDALRASLERKPAKAVAGKPAKGVEVGELQERKPAKRAAKVEEPAVAPAKARAKKRA